MKMKNVRISRIETGLKNEGRKVYAYVFVQGKQNLSPTHIANEVVEQAIYTVLNKKQKLKK